MSKIQKINFHELLDCTKKIDSPFSREIYISNIKKDYGEGVLIKYDMGNGIAVFARSFVTKKDSVLIEEGHIPAGVLIFNLGEKLLFKYKDKKEYTLQKNNFLTALASEQFYSEVYLEANKRYTTVSIGMKEELFLHMTQSIENIDEHIKKVQETSYALLKDGKIDPRQLETLSYFKDYGSYEDLLNNLFLESKISDLSHYTIQRIVSSSSVLKPLKLNKNRIESLKRAKEVILEEFCQDLSIKEIAYKAATNECYLKKDFKEYYEMTVFEMLQKHRMEAAKELLKKRNIGVKEVALKVGYKHSGNFSKTFFKYFQMTPGEYKKNHKNR